MEHLLSIVQDLNSEIFESHGDLPWQFGYTTDGYVEIISFGSENIWCSENDPIMKDMKLYLKNKFNDYVESLSQLKFEVEPYNNTEDYE